LTPAQKRTLAAGGRTLESVMPEPEPALDDDEVEGDAA
jgi:putative endonuclease